MYKKTISKSCSIASRFVVWCIVYAVSVSAHAQESSWKSDAELGVVLTNGNSKTQNINTKFRLLNERDKWLFEERFEVLNASSKNSTTAERYAASTKMHYKFNQHNYLFTLIEYVSDRFSGYDYRLTESLGYGRRLINRASLTLDVELGPGARQSRLETGNSERETIVRVASQLKWTINKNSEFTQELTSDFGNDSNVARAISALKAKVSDNLSMKLSYSVKQSSEVPIGFRKTDSETSVTLVYNLM